MTRPTYMVPGILLLPERLVEENFVVRGVCEPNPHGVHHGIKLQGGRHLGFE